MIDLMAIAAIDRETEVTYIRRERDWAARAAAEGPADRRPGPAAADAAAGRRRASRRTGTATATGNGHGHGHDHGSAVAIAPTARVADDVLRLV